MKELNEAFEALKTYGPGSARALLLPIDEAARAALANPTARQELEKRMLAALSEAGSAEAREFLCAKLTLVGSEQCLPAVAALLSDSVLATAARSVLEALPGSAATKVLRDRLGKVSGRQKAGVIHALGIRRDGRSTPALERFLTDADAQIANAAAMALGEIGTVKAGKALAAFLPKAPEPIRPRLADAVLVCAERLLAAGRRAEAEALYRALANGPYPAWVNAAANRGLSVCREQSGQ